MLACMSLENVSTLNIKNLLERAANIAERSRELSRLRRENYNIFSLLRKESDEVNVHSAFIGDLLDPRGSHEMGGRFAAMFFAQVMDGDDTVGEVVYAETEKWLGNGYADIYLKTEAREIIIENKIDAGDQPEQLLRYNNFLLARTGPDESPLLFYLTKDGSAATKNSIGGKDIRYRRIRYSEHILNWLQACREAAVDHPPLRETIKQYIHLVKKITNQLTDDIMNKELNQLIINNFSTAELVASHFTRAKQELVVSIVKSFVEDLRKKCGDYWNIELELDNYEKLVAKSYGKIILTPKAETASRDGKIKVVIEGSSSMLNGRLIYGIHGSREPTSFGVKFAKRHKKTNRYWVAYDNLLDLSDHNTITSMIGFSTDKEQRPLDDAIYKVKSLCDELLQRSTNSA